MKRDVFINVKIIYILKRFTLLFSNFSVQRNYQFRCVHVDVNSISFFNPPVFSRCFYDVRKILCSSSRQCSGRNQRFVQRFFQITNLNSQIVRISSHISSQSLVRQISLEKKRSGRRKRCAVKRRTQRDFHGRKRSRIRFSHRSVRSFCEVIALHAAQIR